MPQLTADFSTAECNALESPKLQRRQGHVCQLLVCMQVVVACLHAH